MIYKLYLVVFFALTLSISSCGDNDKEEKIEPLRSVKYQVLLDASSERIKSYSGISKAEEEVNLSFKVSGTVEEVLVKLGDKLKKNDIVASLDRSSLLLEFEKKKALLSQNKSEKRKQESNNQRVKELYENNNASLDELNSARASVESARANYTSAQKSMELAQLDLSYTKLRSKSNCLVTEVLISVNENIISGSKIISLDCGSINKVEIGVPESIISSIKKGMKSKIIFDSIEGVKFNALVDEVGVSSSGSSTFPVILKIQENTNKLRSGLNAEVDLIFKIDKKLENNFIYLPLVAIGEDIKGSFAFILEKTSKKDVFIVRRKSVIIGELDSQGLQIKEGLKAGDRVVLAGVSVIYDGLYVEAK